MASLAPTLVQGAPRTPLPFGLFSVLAPREGGQDRWQMGVEWEVLGCEPIRAIGFDGCGAPGPVPGLPKGFTSGAPGLAGASPYTVYGSYNCTPIGNDLAYGEARAREDLANREEAAVERQLWASTIGAVPTLATASAEVIGTGALDPWTAVGELEEYTARTYGSLGVLHVPRGLANALLAHGLVVRQGARLTTAAGTPVVAGAGYPGTGPTGQARTTGTWWAFATPALFGYRSEVFVPSSTPAELLDRATNDLYAVAERTYLIGFDDCGVAAANVKATA